MQLAVGDKLVLENYISGKIGEERISPEVIEPIVLGNKEMEIDSIPSSFSIYQSIVKQERPLNTSKSVLIMPSKDFKSLFSIQNSNVNENHVQVKTSHDRFKSRPDQEYYNSLGIGTEDIDTRGSLFSIARDYPKPNDSARNNNHSLAKENKIVSKQEKKDDLIIVIPGTSLSPINRYNMEKFFKEGIFEFIDPYDLNLDPLAPHSFQFIRNKNDESIIYQVFDNTSKFTKKDWERVVAIFTVGQYWQFKAYPYGENDIANIFKKHCGFYIRIGSEQIPQDTVAKWNVKVLSINKTSRHDDIAIFNEFWKTIDDFILSKN